jgi:hypothetical protein
VVPVRPFRYTTTTGDAAATASPSPEHHSRFLEDLLPGKVFHLLDGESAAPSSVLVDGAEVAHSCARIPTFPSFLCLKNSIVCISLNQVNVIGSLSSFVFRVFCVQFIES